MRLAGNRLTGAIPPALIRLLDLDTASLAGNTLTGCLPVTGHDIRQQDLANLGLPFCDH